MNCHSNCRNISILHFSDLSAWRTFFAFGRNCCNIYNMSQNTSHVLMYVIHVVLLLHCIILFAENVFHVFYFGTDLHIFVIFLLFELAKLKLFLRSHIHCSVHIHLRLFTKEKKDLSITSKCVRSFQQLWVNAYTLALSLAKGRKWKRTIERHKCA